MSRSSYGYDVTTISGNQSWLLMAFDAVALAVLFENITNVVTPALLSLVISVGSCSATSPDDPALATLSLTGTVYSAFPASLMPCFLSCCSK